MDKKIRYFSLIFLVAFVVSVIVAGGLFFSMPELPSNTRNGEICLRNENEEIRCGSTDILLTDYVDKIIYERYIELKREDKRKHQKYLEDNKEYLRSLDKSIWEGKPAARITGKDKHEKRKGSAGMQPLTDNEWACGRELCDSNGFLSNGVRYRNGRLVVPVDGSYFVYSMVDFFETCDPLTGKPTVKDFNNPIKHAIYKFNILDKAEIEIIVNVQPHQISSNKQYNSYSSYVSTIVNLKAGDEVAVKVSNITFIIYKKDNSFGLNLI